MSDRQQTTFAMQQVMRRLAASAPTQVAERKALKADPRNPEDGLPRILADHKAHWHQARDKEASAGFEKLGQYGDEHILKEVPSQAPTSAARGSYLAALASLAPNFTTEIFDRVTREHMGRGELDVVALLVPLAESYLDYKKSWTNSSRVVNLIVDAQAALRDTPEVRASEEAAQWVAEVQSELNTMLQALDAEDPAEAVEVYVSTGSFAHTLPSL